MQKSHKKMYQSHLTIRRHNAEQAKIISNFNTLAKCLVAAAEDGGERI